VAVIAVLAFHSGFGWASGGFLGVSVFFTLSGYLITTLLVLEHERVGSISWRRFVGRRARRLLPASFACLVLVVGLTPWWADSQRAALPGDVFAALANVANWRAAFAGRSYQALFEDAASPLAHFWSLAIEEQAYLVLPMIVLVAIRRGRRRLSVVLGALTIGSVIATLLTSDFDLAYNGTHTRAAELLIGAFAAVVLAGRRPAGRAVDAVGLVSLAVIVVAVVAVRIDMPIVTGGGLPLFALASLGLVFGALGDGPVARLLGVAPFVAIGRVSYGLYLYHWPVFQLLTPARTGLDIVPLTLVRLAVTAVVVLVSYRLLETPIRSGLRLASPSLARGAAAVSVVALVVAVVVIPRPVDDPTATLLRTIDETSGVVTFGQPVEVERVAPASTVAEPAPVMALPTVVVVGSDPAAVGAVSDSPAWEVIDAVDPMCPVASGAEVQFGDGSRMPIAACHSAAIRWRAAFRDPAPTAVVVSLGPVDGGLVRSDIEHDFPDTDDLAEYAARRVRSEEAIGALVDLLAERGVAVFVVDRTGDPFVGRAIDRLSLARPDVRRFDLDTVRDAVGAIVEPSNVPDDATAAEASSDPGPLRLIVFGDSTSFLVAKAIADAAPNDVVVQWAGAEGCAFVDLDATRPASDRAWKPADCPSMTDMVIEAAATFDPDAVLLVQGAMAVMEQRYPGDPDGHLPGSAEYVAVHDAAMERFLELLGDGVRVVVADTPVLGVGTFSTFEMADPARAEAYNAQVDRWDVAHDEVVPFSYRSAIDAWEAEHGNIRIDGSHPEIGALTTIAREVLVPALLDLLTQR
jgi:peptidoglycan/LPS O-acetylase OafA/YrhL